MNDDGAPWPTARVSQASGMVSVQASCTCAQALGMLVWRGKSSGDSLEDVAVAVVERRLSFGADGPFWLLGAR